MSVNVLKDEEKAGQAEVFPENTGAADVTQSELKEPSIVKAERTDPKSEIDPSLQMKLQIANVLAFIVCMTLNATSQKIMPISLNEISTQWTIKIAVASYAVGSIWAVIYFLLAIFTVYQALPNKWVPSRNNELIFGTIKYWFVVNMLSNSVWLILFMLNGVLGFTLALIDITVMLATAFYIMRKCCEVKVNMIEFIAMRIGFTIYTGWVTAATILGVTYVLMSVGMTNPNAGFDETTWCVIIFYVALVIYIAASFYERNPLYAAVYIWVLFGIKAKQTPYSDIQTNAIICVVITILAVLTISGYSIHELKRDRLTKGLFYNIEMK